MGYSLPETLICHELSGCAQEKMFQKVSKLTKPVRLGRDFSCFQAYIEEHPDFSVRQIDSVEGIKGGAVLLTIHFVEQGLQLAFLRPHNDSQSVIDIFNRLYLELRPDIFIELFPVLLADNGVNFPILLPSNSIRKEIPVQKCSIAMPVLHIKKVAVKTTTR